jgi:hypothetical protein
MQVLAVTHVNHNMRNTGRRSGSQAGGGVSFGADALGVESFVSAAGVLASDRAVGSLSFIPLSQCARRSMLRKRSQINGIGVRAAN